MSIDRAKGRLRGERRDREGHAARITSKCRSLWASLPVNGVELPSPRTSLMSPLSGIFGLSVASGTVSLRSLW